MIRVALSLGWIVIIGAGYVAVARHVSEQESLFEKQRAGAEASAVAASAAFGFQETSTELRGVAAAAAAELERGAPSRDDSAAVKARLAALVQQTPGRSAAMVDGDGKVVASVGDSPLFTGAALSDVLGGAQAVVRFDESGKALVSAAAIGRARVRPQGAVVVVEPLSQNAFRRWIGARDSAHVVLQGQQGPVAGTLAAGAPTQSTGDVDVGGQMYRAEAVVVRDDAKEVGRAVGLALLDPCRQTGGPADLACTARKGQRTTDFLKAAFGGVGFFAVLLVWIVGGLAGRSEARTPRTESRTSMAPEPRRTDPKPEAPKPESKPEPLKAEAPKTEPKPEPVKPEPKPEPRHEPPKVEAKSEPAKTEPRRFDPPAPKVEKKEDKPERPALPPGDEPVELKRPKFHEEKKPERPGLPPGDEPVELHKAKEPEKKPERPGLPPGDEPVPPPARKHEEPRPVQAKGQLIPVGAEASVTRGRGASPAPARPHKEEPPAAPPRPDSVRPASAPIPAPMPEAPRRGQDAAETFIPNSARPQEPSLPVIPPAPPLSGLPNLPQGLGLGELPSLAGMGLADLPPLSTDPGLSASNPLTTGGAMPPLGFDPGAPMPPIPSGVPTSSNFPMDAFGPSPTGSYSGITSRDSILPMSPSSWSPPPMDPFTGAAPDAPKPFDEAHYRSVYMDFVGNKRRLGENVDNITYEGFSTKLRNSEQKLIDKHGCRAVRFQVMVKDRQVSLRPQLVR